MKNTFLLLIIALFITSCSSSDDNIIDNPLENTSWEDHYYGYINFNHDISSFTPTEIKDILDKYMFTAIPGSGHIVNHSMHMSFYTSETNDSKRYKIYYNFGPADNLEGKVDSFFSNLAQNTCNKSKYFPNYKYKLTAVDRPDYIAQFGNSIKLVYDNNQNNLYHYKIQTIIGYSTIIFNVWKKNEKTFECPPGSTEDPIPTPDFLTGTWNLDLVYTSGNDPLGEILIDQFELETGSFTKYNLTGKFQEEVNGQITEYPFIVSQSYYDDYTKSMVIQASNGTDIYNFYGAIEQTDNKWKGLLGENSARINQEILGDFIAEKL